MNCNQNDYTQFTGEQFAADECFQQWVLGTDGAGNAFWESYLLLHPGQHEVIIKARRLVEELACGDYSIQPLSSEEKKTIRENIYQTLDLSSEAEVTSFLSPGKKRRQRWAVAAAIAILTLPAYLLIRPGKAPAEEEKNSYSTLTLKTGPGEMKRIILEDSTVVMLNANSSLQYASSFENRPARELRLEGNAFFSVKKDKLHPFIVTARSLVVIVLGTELNVNARSAETEVELTSGSVKVEGAGHQKVNPAYLQAGEKVTLDPTSQTFIKTKMNVELYSAWTEGKWNFRQTSLGEISRLLHEYYGVEIIFKNEKIRHLRINAVIPVTSLQALIPVIEQTLQIKIELVNNQLILQ